MVGLAPNWPVEKDASMFWPGRSGMREKLEKPHFDQSSGYIPQNHFVSGSQVMGSVCLAVSSGQTFRTSRLQMRWRGAGARQAALQLADGALQALSSPKRKGAQP